MRRSQTFTNYLPAAEREEARAEVIAQAYQYVVNAERRGRLHRLTPLTLLAFFGRSYQAGRRMAGAAPSSEAAGTQAAGLATQAIPLNVGTSPGRQRQAA
jgi:hypothetical protein